MPLIEPVAYIIGRDTRLSAFSFMTFMLVMHGYSIIYYSLMFHMQFRALSWNTAAVPMVSPRRSVHAVPVVRTRPKRRRLWKRLY